MEDGAREYKAMPDGVCEGNDAVALEESHAHDVDHAPYSQLIQARVLPLLADIIENTCKLCMKVKIICSSRY